ncbi:hypothetical protein ACFL6I_08575 [candidate division KSB1 bacterium]
MTLEEFKNEALSRFTREITDLFFCYIENDEELFQKYQRVIGRESNLDETNQDLGKTVKEWFGLENGDVNTEPKSKLIRSYTEHVR